MMTGHGCYTWRLWEFLLESDGTPVVMLESAVLSWQAAMGYRDRARSLSAWTDKRGL